MPKKIPLPNSIFEMKIEKGVIPLIGWHNPFAEFETANGEKWTISIAGGVKAITLQRENDECLYSVGTDQIVGAMLAAISEDNR